MSLALQHVNELQQTFRTGRTRTYEWRLQQLKQIVKLVEENEDRFIEALRKDSGKAAFTSLAGEILVVKSEANYAIKKLKKWMKPKKVSTPLFLWPTKSSIQPTPYGVVLIGVAWNFPVQLTLGPLVAALAAGNCAVIKPPSMSPEFCKLIEELVPKYFDNDAVRAFQPQGEDRNNLLSAPFDLILYTGSAHVGRIVMRAAAENLTPVLLELGGKNPCIVTEDAILDATANRIVDAKFMNAGQICVNVDYILAHESIKDQLVEKLVEKIKVQQGDDPQKSLAYSRIINDHHWQRLMALCESGDVVIGGTGDQEDRYIAPTVLDNVDINSDVMKDEVFGPILPVLTYKTKQDILDIMARYGKPLCFYIFSKNGPKDPFTADMVNSTESGGVGINSVMLHTVNHNLPFGGVGESGMGTYHGKFGFDAFSHTRAICSKSAKLDFDQAYPPYTEEDIGGREKAMRFLIK